MHVLFMHGHIVKKNLFLWKLHMVCEWLNSADVLEENQSDVLSEL